MIKNEEKLKEIIFEDSYAKNELEACEAQLGKDNPMVQELRKAVNYYYEILKDHPSEIAMKQLRSLIDRKTLTPIYNNEDDWIQAEYDSDISTHRRRPSVMRIKKKNGEYVYTDLESVNIVNQDKKVIKDARILSMLSFGLNSVDFPYMYYGKTWIFIILSDTVAKVVSIRTPEGKSINVNKCYELKDFNEITEKQFYKIMSREAGKQ